MKQLLVYMFMIVTVVFMVILISKNEEEISVKLLTVDTYYSFIDTESESIYIDFYLSDHNHPLIDKQSYDQLEIHNDDHSKSMYLSLTDVIFQHEEYYLSDTYYKYSYIIEMPLLGYDFDIEDCYLTINLVNQETYDIFIGSLSLKTVEDNNESPLDWTSLSGMKMVSSYLSRLHQIQIDYVTLNKTITNVSVGSLYQSDFELVNNQLKINIFYKQQLFYACPIVITFEDQTTTIINYFIYIKDFETLKQSGQLIYHYALN